MMNLQKAQQKIQRILRDNLYERTTLATSGALNFNRLSKYRTSKRLFDRKVIQSGKHYNVTLLVDISGSMNNYMLTGALMSVQNTIRLLKGIANVKVSLFNAYHRDNIDKDVLMSLKARDLYSHYRNKYMEVPVYVNEYGEIDRYGDKEVDYCASYSNIESINIEYEAKRLLAMDGIPILMIFQDGVQCPSSKIREYKLIGKSIFKYYSDSFEKNLYKKLSKQLYMLSVGIDTYEPEHLHENFAYVEDAEDIYEVVVKVFERLIS